MAYGLSFTRRAARDLDHIYGTINATESEAAERWYLRLEQSISTLADTPNMGSPTHEDPYMRQLIYGRKPHFYRIIYKVNDKKRVVTIFQIRHGRQRPFTDAT